MNGHLSAIKRGLRLQVGGPCYINESNLTHSPKVDEVHAMRGKVRPEYGATYATAAIGYDNGSSGHFEVGLLPYISRSAGWLSRWPAPKGVAEMNREDGWLRLNGRGLSREQRLEGDSNSICFDLHLSQCVANRSEPETSVNHGLRNVEIVEAVERQIQKHLGLTRSRALHSGRRDSS